MVLVGNLWTLAQLEVELANFMDDVAYARWSQAKMDRAIRAAIRSAPPKWWEERIDGNNTYDEDTFRYTLPVTCESVEEIWFEQDDDDPRFFVSPRSWHIEGNELVFTDKYPRFDGQILYMLYIHYPLNLLTVNAIDGVVASTTTKTITDASAAWATAGVRIGDPLHLLETDNPGYAGNGEYYITVVGNVGLQVDRAFGTVAASLVQRVAHYTDLPLTYILYFGAAFLYEMAARNRPGVEVDEYLRLASWYRQLAEQELRKQRKSRPARRRY